MICNYASCNSSYFWEMALANGLREWVGGIGRFLVLFEFLTISSHNFSY